MRAKFYDATGLKFGFLLVLRDSRNGFLQCRCECGTERQFTKAVVVSGHCKSCGCLRRRTASALNATHRASKTTLYRLWHGIKARCLYPSNTSWHLYGGRGITICDRWRYSFEAFVSDMGPRPSLKHSVDRYPDQNGNYEPGNCRWATKEQQDYNKRTTIRVECDGRTLTLLEWSRISSVPQKTIGERIRNGWPPRAAIYTEPSFGNSIRRSAGAFLAWETKRRNLSIGESA